MAAEVAKDAGALSYSAYCDGVLYFGAANTVNVVSFWLGLIDGVCIYNQALIAGEIENLARQ